MPAVHGAGAGQMTEAGQGSADGPPHGRRAGRGRADPAPAMSRRSFAAMAGGAGLLAAGLASGDATDALAASADEASRPIGPKAALRLLMAGNLRWVRGTARHPRQSPKWRRFLADHQNPFATVVSCIDSRVPPEIVFDCGLGEMFVIRTGAQTLDDQVVLGSIEFGPAFFASARLMFVLGHQGCGAVEKAIGVIRSGGRAPGHIQAVVDALRPAYYVAKPQPGCLVDNMVRAQIRLTVQRLKADPLLGNQLIVGGYYAMASGAVDIIA
jgi:carbonic anhydrase